MVFEEAVAVGSAFKSESVPQVLNTFQLIVCSSPISSPEARDPSGLRQGSGQG